MDYSLAQKQQQATYFSGQGGGLWGGQAYPYVLQDAFRCENLYPGIREQALAYYAAEGLTWWNGTKALPTTLTIATEIHCLNHTFWLAQGGGALQAFAQAILPGSHPVPFANGHWVAYVYDGGFFRSQGLKRTLPAPSFHLALLVETPQAGRTLLAVDWKYTEKHYQKAHPDLLIDPLYQGRDNKYGPVLINESGPFRPPAAEDVARFKLAFMVEPYYRMMQLTLLLETLLQNGIEGIVDYHYAHMLPIDNTALRQNATSPLLLLGGKTLAEQWQACLHQPDRYSMHDGPGLCLSLAKQYDSQLAAYLLERYGLAENLL